ncbi:unnamed protein product [Cyprideis torosa]|uniref:Uncharacterized protein n=1 Tax=Cyprideis torosa TaxID=163714 RepID=A0A7R8WYQ9_9CRUS|nr:unnamed protein product [Cyprideis torosa]CAG0909968.1 unnamed protein product [Cyprideis torosa]
MDNPTILQVLAEYLMILFRDKNLILLRILLLRILLLLSRRLRLRVT